MFTAVTNLFAWFIGSIPQIKIPIITISPVITDIINAVWYFLPMETISNVFTFGLIITSFRIVLAIIIRVKSFIPLSGGA